MCRYACNAYNYVQIKVILLKLMSSYARKFNQEMNIKYS